MISSFKRFILVIISFFCISLNVNAFRINGITYKEVGKKENIIFVSVVGISDEMYMCQDYIYIPRYVSYGGNVYYVYDIIYDVIQKVQSWGKKIRLEKDKVNDNNKNNK